MKPVIKADNGDLIITGFVLKKSMLRSQLTGVNSV
jgi:hypothetical protein